MKELESTQLNSLALQITVATSKISVGGGAWPRSTPKLCFGIVWKSISRLAPKPCQDQFSSMDGFRPMPYWSCLVYLVSEGNLSNSARSQQETPSGLSNQNLLRSIIIRLFTSFTFGFFFSFFCLPNEHWKFWKSHRVVKLACCVHKTCSFWTTTRFFTQAELLEKPALVLLPDEGSPMALSKLLRACVTSALFGYRVKKQWSVELQIHQVLEVT